MITINDYLERSNSGPIMEEKDFDLKVAKTLRRLYDEYKDRIKYDLNEIIPDDETADALFEAGVKFLCEVGMYNKDSGRVINFACDEVMKLQRRVLVNMFWERAKTR